MILVLDAGNSRVKWGFHDGAKWLSQGNVDNDEIPSMFLAWQGQPRPDRVIGSNVAGEGVRTRLGTQLSRWRVQPQWVSASDNECGVTNSYERPAQLGSDRWAGLIAAWKRVQRSCLVVNAGTAMTIDALSGDGVFMGGIILPGLMLMHRTLASNTAMLKVPQGKFTQLPTNSADAIYSGAVQALAGAIERIGAVMRDAGQADPACIISGGAAPNLQPHLNFQATLVDNLVLEGLLAIDQSRQTK